MRGTWIVLGMVYVALLVRTLMLLLPWRRSRPEAAERRKSLATWWVLAVMLTGTLLSGRLGLVVLFCLISLLAWREYLSLIPTRETDRPIHAMMYPVIGVHYLFVYLGWENLFAVFLPLFGLWFTCVVCTLREQTRGFLHAVTTLYLGMMLIAYCLSHAAGLVMLPEALNPVGGAVGWVLFLVLLTAVNDIAQAVWGRWLGRRQILPVVSPGKTWEGLLGGIATTVVIGLLAGPVLLPLVAYPPAGVPLLAEWPRLGIVPAALLIAVGGFLGDVTLSAIKRDLGRKDSGTMLPGQGGILDRVDSLMLTSPLFYWYVRVLYGV